MLNVFQQFELYCGAVFIMIRRGVLKNFLNQFYWSECEAGNEIGEKIGMVFLFNKFSREREIFL